MTAVGRRLAGPRAGDGPQAGDVAWAIEHGLEALETGNDVDNGPMRAVNAKLGYRPIPDQLTLHGPLAPG